MSLQYRLFSFFIAIVVLPLLIATFFGRSIIVRELEERTYAQLGAAQQAAAAIYDVTRVSSRDRVQLVAGTETFSQLLLEKRYVELREYVLDQMSQGENPIDYMIVAEPSGTVLVEALAEPEFVPGVKPLTAEEILTVLPTNNPRRWLFTFAIQAIRSPDDVEELATVVGGDYVDNDFLLRLTTAEGVNASLLVEERINSTTIESLHDSSRPVIVDLSESPPFMKTRIAGIDVYGAPGLLSRDVAPAEASFLMTTSQQPIAQLTSDIQRLMLFLLILAFIGSVLLGFSLARVISRPLRELALGANAISAGNYDQHIAVRTKDEMGQLARSFNEMAQRLSVHITELKESREELKRALTRFAETLRSTHDLGRLLPLVLETSIETLRAERGLLMMMTPARDSLVVKVEHGFDGDEFEVSVGEGIAGKIAETGEPVRLPNGDGAPDRAPQEPEFRTKLAVPIFSQERVIAVLMLYDKEDGMNFSEADMGTLLSIADVAGVAIENVLLHEDIKRQAITDGLTATWNWRYFRIRYEQEIERAARFSRPFSLCVIDIDHFKQFNDTYGHQRGDSVLIELARRVKDQIRDIDALARYGGEEFVLILPETDEEGAERTAEKIRASVGETPFQGEPPLTVTVSIGVATYPIHGSDQDTLLNHADQAMYAAKAAGRNQVVVHRPPEVA
ncbi:MAG: diguanylate cyclase [Actinobacteria bacterium]|nr:diguanylate cyclase [Actinomycetota bacterium]